MTKGEIINKVYDDMIEVATRLLFQKLILAEEYQGEHAEAERRFGNALRAADRARERARILIEGVE